MARQIVVFLGPSLDVSQALRLLDAEYLPPAEQGSIFALMSRTRLPDAILLIDGAFGRVPAVRHKEILYAMSVGVAVHGAASMGALRAAELAQFGMRGHGLIYRWYRGASLVDDDEVAVAMTSNEMGAQALSEALVNIRLTLRLAERRGRLSRSLRLTLEELAAAIYFPARSYERIFRIALGRFEANRAAELEAIESWVTANRLDQKARDASAALSELASGSSHLLARQTSRITASEFELTQSWADDLEDSGHDISTIPNARNDR